MESSVTTFQIGISRTKKFVLDLAVSDTIIYKAFYSPGWNDQGCIMFMPQV